MATPARHPLRIMHLTTVASSHRHLLLPQLSALAEAGHDVIAVSADGPDVPFLEANGIRHIPLVGSTRGFDLKGDLRAAWSFAQIVRRERPDVVHTHNPKPGIYGRLLGRLLRVPIVVNTVHGLYATPDDGLARRAVVYSMEAVASRFSHLELVQNIEDVELMTSTPLAPSHKVRFLGNGIDLGRFSSRTGIDRTAVRRELGLEEDDVVIGSVGRLVAEKGFVELLEASASLGARHKLVIVGPDDPEKADALQPELIQQAKDRGVLFLGQRNDIPQLLTSFDVFVLASHREGFPRAAMEAAASGLPLVATDIRGCRQVIEEGVNGLLVPRRDPRALCEALRRLVGDAQLRQRMGEAGRSKAEAEFSETAVVDRLFDAYGELSRSPS